jgi:hypothetical protein
VTFLAVQPDRWLGDWAWRHYRRVENADGSLTVTA